MAEVTHEMILDYITKKGGVVRNVDLVRHFKKYLQVENAPEKGKSTSKAWCCGVGDLTTGGEAGSEIERPCLRWAGPVDTVVAHGDLYDNS